MGDELHDVIHQIRVEPTDHPEIHIGDRSRLETPRRAAYHRYFTVTFIPALADSNGASSALIGTTAKSSATTRPGNIVLIDKRR